MTLVVISASNASANDMPALKMLLQASRTLKYSGAKGSQHMFIRLVHEDGQSPHQYVGNFIKSFGNWHVESIPDQK